MHLAQLATQIFFAGNAVAMKIALRAIDARALIGLRLASASLIFVALWAATGRETIARRDWPRLVGYAMLGVAANQILFAEGVAHTTATDAIVIGAVQPVFAFAFAVMLGRERATRGKLAGLVVALAGALLLAGDVRHFRGNLLVVANSLCYGLYLVLSRELFARYRALTVISWLFVVGAIVDLPITLLPSLRQAPLLDAHGWAAIAWVSLLGSVSAYFLVGWSLRRAPSSLVAVYIYLQPLLGALSAALLLGERPSPLTFVAGGLILVGIGLVSLGARRALSRPRPSAAPPP